MSNYIENLKKFNKIHSLDRTDFKDLVVSFVNGEYVGFTQEQRYYFLLGSAEVFLTCRIITEDSYYDIVNLLDCVYKAK